MHEDKPKRGRPPKGSFFIVENDIFETRLPWYGKLVYMWYRRCSNQDGECFPSLKRTAQACGIGIATVKRAHKLLKSAELINWQRGRKRYSNCYSIDGISKAKRLTQSHSQAKKEQESRELTLSCLMAHRELSDGSQGATNNTNINKTNSNKRAPPISSCEELITPHLASRRERKPR